MSAILFQGVLEASMVVLTMIRCMVALPLALFLSCSRDNRSLGAEAVRRSCTAWCMGMLWSSF